MTRHTCVSWGRPAFGGKRCATRIFPEAGIYFFSLVCHDVPGNPWSMLRQAVVYFPRHGARHRFLEPGCIVFHVWKSTNLIGKIRCTSSMPGTRISNTHATGRCRTDRTRFHPLWLFVKVGYVLVRMLRTWYLPGGTIEHVKIYHQKIALYHCCPVTVAR